VPGRWGKVCQRINNISFDIVSRQREKMKMKKRKVKENNENAVMNASGKVEKARNVLCSLVFH